MKYCNIPLVTSRRYRISIVIFTKLNSLKTADPVNQLASVYILLLVTLELGDRNNKDEEIVLNKVKQSKEKYLCMSGPHQIDKDAPYLPVVVIVFLILY